MGKGGRYGKYGETKRIARLRKAADVGGYFRRRGADFPGPPGIHKKRTIYRGSERITLRQASGADSEFIRRLSQKVFHVYGPYEEMLPRWFESGITVTILASTEKKPVGFAMLGRPSEGWQFDLVGEVLAIAVEPERQNMGIGDLLMEGVITRAETLHTEMLILHTGLENHPAKRLFRKHGFVVWKIKKEFYPEGQDALLMQRCIP